MINIKVNYYEIKRFKKNRKIVFKSNLQWSIGYVNMIHKFLELIGQNILNN